MVRQIILEFRNSNKILRSTKDLNVNISTILQDTEGRILCLNFSIEKQNYRIMNIYAPTRNSEKTKFYKTLKNYIELKLKANSRRRFQYAGGHPIRYKRWEPKHNPYIRPKLPN